MTQNTPQKKKVGFAYKFLTILTLLLFTPLGLILLWVRNPWTKLTQTILSIVAVGWFSLLVFTPNDQDAESVSPQSTPPSMTAPEEATKESAVVVNELNEQTLAEIKRYEEYVYLIKRRYLSIVSTFEDTLEDMTFEEFVEESLKERDKAKALQDQITAELGNTVMDYKGSRYCQPLFLRTKGTAHFLLQVWQDGHRYFSQVKGRIGGGTKEEYEHAVSLYLEDYNDLCDRIENLSDGQIIIKR